MSSSPFPQSPPYWSYLSELQSHEEIWDPLTDEKFSYVSGPLSPSSLSPLPPESPVDALEEPPLPPDLTHLTHRDLITAEIKQEPEVNEVREKLLQKLSKRRVSDLGVSPLPKESSGQDSLSAAEVTRLERRRASNRRAAAKSRVKKKQANDVLGEELMAVEQQNRTLVTEIQKLRTELATMERVLTEHRAICSLHIGWPNDHNPSIAN